MPVITIGENTADDFAGIEDAQIKENAATNNYGGSSIIELTKYEASDHTNSLIKMTDAGLSNIPGGSTITSVSLLIYLTISNGGNDVHSIKRVLVDWEEGTQDGANRQNDTPDSCCWNEYGSGNSWTTAGCLSDGNDRSATVSATMTEGEFPPTGQYYEFADAQMVADFQNWLDLIWSNYGYVIERTDGENDYHYKVYASSEGTDGQRPYLEIDYTEGGGGGISMAVIMHHKKMRQ